MPSNLPVIGPARVEPDASFRYRFANVEFDESSGLLRVAGQAVPIEPRPLRLLSELLRHADEVLTREELLEAVWEGGDTYDHVLNSAVSRLRQALGEAGAACIVTVPRVGYRLTGPVHKLRTTTPMQTLVVGATVPGRENYRLERALGEPARNDVWLARHIKLGQLAVFKFADDGARLLALKREYALYRVLRRELGPRDDFAQVLDANFQFAPYFLECEFGGLSLLEWADQPTAAGPNRLQALTTTERLGLFVPICRAVAAAHSVGVLHKDLKPGNVLVDQRAGEPGGLQVRLTDFGSGRLSDRSRLEQLQVTADGLTQTQDALHDSRSGTLMYLAPEVLAGQSASTRSDIYALGLILYQIMAGDLRRPLATGWERDIDDELLRLDIRAATEGRPEERLAAASELADLLEALDARRASLVAQARLEQEAQQSRDELQRRRARRPWLATLALAVVVGLASSLWFGLQAQRARDLALAEAERARSINEFLDKDVLQSADLSRAGNVSAVTMSEVLQRAGERARLRFKSQPLTESAILLQLGRVYLHMEVQAQAADAFRRAIDLLLPQVRADDLRLAMARYGLAQALAAYYDAAGAQQVLQLAVSQVPPARLQAEPELAIHAWRAQSDVAAARGEYPAAVEHARRLVAAVDAWPAAEPADRHDARQRLAEALLLNGQIEESQALLATLTTAPYSAANVGQLTYARAMLTQARLHFEKSQPAQARGLLEQVVQTLRAIHSERSVPYAHASYLLSELQFADQQFDQARQSLLAARQAFESTLGALHGYVMSVRANVAVVDLARGDTAAAAAELQAVQPWFAQRKKADGVNFHLAVAYNDLRRPQEALQLLDALDLKQLSWLSWGTDDWKWRVQAERGRAYVATGRVAEGRRLIDTALPEMQRLGSADWVVRRLKRQSHELRAGG